MMSDLQTDMKKFQGYRILVISDTHGVLPDWVGEKHFDAVLHAGDIGNERVLTALSGYENLHVVRGNIDGSLLHLPETVRTTVGGVRFFVVHNLTSPHRIMPSNAEILSEWQPRVVVFGHTHQPMVCERQGVIYVNPGTLAGEPIGSHGTYAVVTVEGEEAIRIEVYGRGSEPLLRWPQ